MAVAVAARPVENVVPRIWPGSTVVCLGTGPSLTQDDVAYCQDRAKVIAVKDAIFLAPWADALYCGEDRWWHHYGPTLTYGGLRYTIHSSCGQWATLLKYGAELGLDPRPTHLACGKTSGYQAIDLAVHFGAKKVVLLGYDMKPGADGRPNVTGEHPYHRRSYAWHYVGAYQSLMPAMRVVGVELVNASRQTAIEDVPRCSLAEALA